MGATTVAGLIIAIIGVVGGFVVEGGGIGSLINIPGFMIVVVGTLGANYVWAIGHTDQVSADLELPLWIVYLCIPLGSYLMCFRFLQVAWSFYKTGELPHHDHGHVEGIEEVTAIDIIPYVLKDNLHPADAKRGGKS